MRICKHITIRGRKIAANEIVAARTGETLGGTQISTVDGVDIYWDARTEYPVSTGGMRDDRPPVCEALDATIIDVYPSGDVTRGIVRLRV